MKQTLITITRDNAAEIEVEVNGRYCPVDYGGQSASGLPVVNEPERFEDIEAVVVEDAYLDGDDRVIAYKAGEVIRLTHREEEQANNELLKAYERD